MAMFAAIVATTTALSKTNIFQLFQKKFDRKTAQKRNTHAAITSTTASSVTIAISITASAIAVPLIAPVAAIAISVAVSVASVAAITVTISIASVATVAATSVATPVAAHLRFGKFDMHLVSIQKFAVFGL
jgi:hypothetical protein